MNLRSSEANTESPDLSQIAAAATTEISTATTGTRVSTACSSEIPFETNDAIEKIPVATSEIPVTTVLSSDVLVNNDAIPENSLEPTETQAVKAETSGQPEVLFSVPGQFCCDSEAAW
ncbi:hypothetical protein AOLI_G00181010 [Acnodon oligacanthus]